MKMRARWSWVIGLLLVAVTSLVAGCEKAKVVTDGDPPEKVPKEVKQAEQLLTKWLDGFKNQTSEEVQKSLGAPSKESTWLFKEKKELLMKYKIGDSTELSLYFSQGRVVKTGLHLLP
jgi:hypothetical protein